MRTDKLFRTLDKNVPEGITWEEDLMDSSGGMLHKTIPGNRQEKNKTCSFRRKLKKMTKGIALNCSLLSIL